MANDQIILGGGGPAGRIDEPVPPAASPAGFKDQSGNLALGSLDGSGNLKVAVTGAGSGGTSSVDEATFTPGVSAGTPVMGAVNPSDNPADGTLAIAALDSDRNLKVNIVAGGTGGGAVTIADGADVTEGAIADVAVTGDNSGTISAKLRGLDKIWADVWDSVNHWLKVSIQNATLAVTQSGSWTVTAAQATFASLKATITGNGTAGTPDAGVVTVQGITSMTALKVDGSASTQPVSGTVTVQQSTATNLKAAVTGLGTAGTADTGVQTIQGIASMTPVQVSQATAASLNATVVGTGTFATQSAITAASGAIASGAIASGAVASGAFASGSIAVGAIAAGATSIADNEDVASADGDRGVKVLVTRKATPANTSGTDGDYEFLQVNAGRLWTQGNNVRVYASAVTLTTTNFVSLANGSAWQSVGIATGGNDVHFLLTTKTTGTAYVDLYVAEELSGGSTWTDGATGTEGTFTAANRLNSRYLGSIRLNNASASAAFKASDVFGVIPANVALIAINNSGASISATGGDTVFTYQLVA